MKRLLPLTLVAALFLVGLIANSCGFYFVELKGYVDIPNGHITKDEIKSLNFNNVWSLDNQAVPNLEPFEVQIEYRRVTDTSFNHFDYLTTNNQEIYERHIDSFLSLLNLQDSVRLTFYLSQGSNSLPDNDMKEDFFGGYFMFESTQSHVISSQAVVDLKRNPDGNAIVAYPSPSDNEVSIKFNLKEPRPGHFVLIGPMGKMIEEVDHPNVMHPYTFMLDGLSAGTYYIQATIDGENFMKKFIKR